MRLGVVINQPGAAKPEDQKILKLPGVKPVEVSVEVPPDGTVVEVAQLPAGVKTIEIPEQPVEQVQPAIAPLGAAARAGAVEGAPQVPPGRKIILYQRQSPGDILTMSNPVGDLKRTYPDWFIDVKSPAQEVWLNNPHLTPLDENDPTVEKYDVTYDDINISGWDGLHFTDAFRYDIERKLNSNPAMVSKWGRVEIRKTSFRPELYISDDERSWWSQVHCEFFWDGPYWVINAGRKPDNELKQYHRWQESVAQLNEYFAGRVKIVQMGHESHIHPPLEGTFSLVGKTDIRQLIRLIYWSHGTIGPLSFQFVISGAFEQPAVCVAGGKEGVPWHLYPHMRYIYTNGALECCRWDGCWLGGMQGECKDSVDGVPHCFRLIEPHMIADGAKMYYEGGRLPMPTEEQVEEWTKDILILEDQPDRQEAFQQKLGHTHRLTILDNAKAAIKILGEKSFDVISLDHHLTDEKPKQGQTPNTGETVAKFLAKQKPDSHIIVHCHDGFGVKLITKHLPQAEHRPGYWV